MSSTGVAPPAPDPPRWSPGATVALREVWRGRVWFARPAIVVEDTLDASMFHVPSGVRFYEPVDEAGRYLKVYADAWRLVEAVGDSPDSALSFAFPDTAYGIILSYGPTGVLRHYYVNVQTPLRRTPIGFDYVDHLLDAVIPADRSSWAWKDEDELDEAVRRGVFTPEEVTWIRHWGERAVEHVLLAEPPFDRDWSRWRPDPAWPVPSLPPRWGEVKPARVR
jgi:hypothetical protein